MRLPTAATDPNPGGFTWTQEGELVYPAPACDDPDCDCRRSFAGLTTGRATTRAVIEDIPIDPRILVGAVLTCLERGGWVAGAETLTDDEAGHVAEVVGEMTGIGETFPAGTVLARNDLEIYPVAAHDHRPVRIDT